MPTNGSINHDTEQNRQQIRIQREKSPILHLYPRQFEERSLILFLSRDNLHYDIFDSKKKKKRHPEKNIHFI